MQDENEALELYTFGEEAIGVTMINGQPWFAGSDLARVLEYRDARDALRAVDGPNVRTHPVRTDAGMRVKLHVNEAGLYQMILRSRSKRAHEFQRWVTGEVLPAIRRTGAYVPPPFDIPSDYAAALRAAADAYEAGEAAREFAQQQEQRALVAEETVAQLEPKATYVDAIVASDVDEENDRDMSVAVAAKHLARDENLRMPNGDRPGERHLFEYLEQKLKWLVRRSGALQPYQEAINRGLMTMAQRTWVDERGLHVTSQPRVTRKGLVSLYVSLGGNQTALVLPSTAWLS